MKTITVYLENDLDASNLMQTIESTHFTEGIEAYVIDESLSDEDIEEFEDCLDDYNDEPFSEESYLEFKKEVLESYGIGYIDKPGA